MCELHIKGAACSPSKPPQPPTPPPIPRQLLAIDEDDELGEVELAGFDSGRQTLLCSNTLHDTLLQVTAGVRV